MKLGVMAPYADGQITSGPFLRDWTAAVESHNVESVWAVEHVVVAESYEPRYPYSADGHMPSRAASVAPMPDPLELLSFMAACSTTLNLGTAVVVAPLHSPAVLAKRAATLHTLSGGRLRLGLGIGWQREEYAAVGAPFSERGRRLEDCIGAMRALWQDDPATFHSPTISFDRVHMMPKPPAGRVPILLGGNSDAAVRRAGRIADGWFPFTISPEDLEQKTEVLREGAKAAGRDVAGIEITAWPGSFDPNLEFEPSWVRRFADAGATRLIIGVPMRSTSELSRLGDRIARYQDEVIANM